VLGETSALSSLAAALLTLRGMSLGLHPCTAAEGSCPPAHRCWEAESVAVCSRLCAVMMSNKGKPAYEAQHTEMGVSFTDWESQWSFLCTGDVTPLLLGGAQILQPSKGTAQPHYSRTPKRGPCCLDLSMHRPSSSKLNQISLWTTLFQSRIDLFHTSSYSSPHLLGQQTQPV